METVRRRGQRGFTLVEMLAVLTIIGLMVGIAIPVFNIIGADRGVKADILRLNGVLRFARNNAVMNRTHTYVVFVRNYTGVIDEHRHRAFAVMEGTATEPEAYVSEWHTLAAGSFFIPVGETTWPKRAGGFDVIGPADSTAVEIPYPNSESTSTIEAFAVQFRPDGRARYYRTSSGNSTWNIPSELYVSVAPGFINESTGVVVVPQENRNRAGRIEIQGRTGTSLVRYNPRP